MDMLQFHHLCAQHAMVPQQATCLRSWRCCMQAYTSPCVQLQRVGGCWWHNSTKLLLGAAVRAGRVLPSHGRFARAVSQRGPQTRQLVLRCPSCSCTVSSMVQHGNHCVYDGNPWRSLIQPRRFMGQTESPLRLKPKKISVCYLLQMRLYSGSQSVSNTWPQAGFAGWQLT